MSNSQIAEACGDDDQVAPLQAAGELVQVVEACRDAERFIFVFVQKLDAFEKIADGLADRHHLVFGVIFRYRKNGRFAFFNDGLDRLRLVVSKSRHVAGRAD